MVYKLLTDLLLWGELFLDSKRSKNTLLLSCAKHWFVLYRCIITMQVFFVFSLCYIAFVTKLILYLCWDFRFSHRIMDNYLYNKALLAIKIDMTCICIPETLLGIKLITKNFRFLTHLLSNYHYFYSFYSYLISDDKQTTLFFKHNISFFFSFYHAFA